MSIVTTGTTFIARFRLDPARKDEFLRTHKEIMDASGALMEQEANFAFYGWGREENEWVAIESWKREETLNALRSHPDFAASVKRLLACCRAPVEITLYVGTASSQALFDLYPRGVSKFHPRVGDLHVTFV
jgi:quinol monooxygenase YgiN